MVLVNTFEETFGGMFGKGVWSKLSEQAFKIDHTVVALASFIGNCAVPCTISSLF